MVRIYRFSIYPLFILSFSTLLSAQEQRGVDGPMLSPVITAATAGEKVRFGSPAAGIAQIRVQIISANGGPLFDSAWKDGNMLDWPIESPEQPLANGSYRCVVMVKDLDGQVTQKEAVLTAEGGQVSIEPRAGNDALTMVGAGESGPKITMLAHDERNGSIVNTSGDLSFRFGEFFAGKDSEKMRLTAEGSLGIGTDKPQAPLDVNGLIRTSKGIMFPDGTILTTAGGEAATGPGDGVNRLTPSTAGGAGPGSQTSANSRRLTPRPNAPAYQFVVDSLGVHIGTTSAYGLDVAGNVVLSSNLTLPASSSTAGTILQGGSRLLHTSGVNSVFLGLNAGNFITAGDRNTAIGAQALFSNTTGSTNTASGYQALFSNTTGSSNTASGDNALAFNTTGGNNTASGFFALNGNTTGGNNTASGGSALRNNTTGLRNTASGASALFSNNGGTDNTASGSSALFNNTFGDNNTASGVGALQSNTTGFANTASGVGALSNNTTGSNNIAVGFGAGYLTTGNYNIDIGHVGVAGEAGTIRIGTANLIAPQHTRAFLAGVRGVATGAIDGLTVLIDSNGQLGTAQSSASVKRDIAGMGEQSSALMKLRPVSFFYRSDAVGIRQYGLIAEEVAEVMPELVQFSPAGEAETVRYHFLAPLLLNQVQKQHRQIEEQGRRNEEQDRRNAEQQKTIEALNTTLDVLGQRLQALERQAAIRPD